MRTSHLALTLLCLAAVTGCGSAVDPGAAPDAVESLVSGAGQGLEALPPPSSLPALADDSVMAAMAAPVVEVVAVDGRAAAPGGVPTLTTPFPGTFLPPRAGPAEPMPLTPTAVTISNASQFTFVPGYSVAAGVGGTVGGWTSIADKNPARITMAQPFTLPRGPGYAGELRLLARVEQRDTASTSAAIVATITRSIGAPCPGKLKKLTCYTEYVYSRGVFPVADLACSGISGSGSCPGTAQMVSIPLLPQMSNSQLIPGESRWVGKGKRAQLVYFTNTFSLNLSVTGSVATKVGLAVASGGTSTGLATVRTTPMNATGGTVGGTANTLTVGSVVYALSLENTPIAGCANGIKDGLEVGVDCGGSVCAPCNVGGTCVATTDCATGLVCTGARSNGVKLCQALATAGVTCRADLECATGFCSRSEQVCRPASCGDGALSGNETDVDCGGSCDRCLADDVCTSGLDCSSGRCVAGVCAAPSCSDKVKAISEMGVDCGGSCGTGCRRGQRCVVNTDCAGGLSCVRGACAKTSCKDGVKGGAEADVDCGLACGRKKLCSVDRKCNANGDCSSGKCLAGMCAAPSCADGVKNGAEGGVDCGAACGIPCDTGASCTSGADCLSNRCVRISRKLSVCQPATCSDRIKNNGELDVDCGDVCEKACSNGQTCREGADCASGNCAFGRCQPASCSDGFRSPGEGGVDCGGACIQRCVLNAQCAANADCTSRSCSGGYCTAATCSDKKASGNETDVDCGGSCGATCALGRRCAVSGDCSSGACVRGVCSRASCSDGIQNNGEVGVDCGGTCAACGANASCSVDGDCSSGLCDAATSSCTLAVTNDGVRNGAETDIDCGGTSSKRCQPGRRCVADTDCVSGADCKLNVCECPAGTVCDQDPCVTANCAANARCLVATDNLGNRSATCACDTSISSGNGTACTDIDECSVTPDICGANATCTNIPFGYTCSCATGYDRQDGACVDIDECLAINACGDGSTCVNQAGSYDCVCSTGFVKDSDDSDNDGSVDDCVDINECATNNGGCHENADCTNVPGGRECECDAGLWGDGTVCSEVGPCETDNGGCGDNASCSADPDTEVVTCTCAAGFEKVGGVCVDVNECATDNGGCGEGATCKNEPGYRTCSCNDGYTGTGGSCVEVNECLVNNGDCHVLANCANTAGSFTCSCKDGTEPSGSGTGTLLVCADVNECLSDNGGCDDVATCVNQLASPRTCICPSGYTTTDGGVTCVDVNECDTAGSCALSATCTNTAGGFTCSCPTGYSGDAYEAGCTDTNECAAATNPCPGQTCSNVPGGYGCGCAAGYEGSAEDPGECVDIDECTLGRDNCSANATCTNTDGGFDCECNAGYTGDGVTCESVGLCAGVTCATNTTNPCRASAGTCNPSTGECSYAAINENGACTDSNACTSGDRCVAGTCSPTTTTTCTASDSCHTAGTCDPSTGVCSDPAKAAGTSCDDGDACTYGDSCSAGAACAGTAYTCNATECEQSSTCDGTGSCTVVDKSAGVACTDDGAECTTDLCDGSGTCAHANKNGATACSSDSNGCTSDFCDGSGVCGHTDLAEGASCTLGGGGNGVCKTVAGDMDCADGCYIGGAHYANGAVNPSAECQVCNPSASRTAWTSKAAGTSCSTDNNSCTTDVCGSGANAGSCVHPAVSNDTPCSGGLCQSGVCDARCSISGSSYQADDINGLNSCQSCQPGVSAGSWSSLSAGTACASDSNECTTDQCGTSSGSMACDHVAVANGTSCSAGYCSSGSCAVGCSIGGVGYNSGDANPSNSCQVCTPGTSKTAWSAKSCSSGYSCNTSNGACEDVDECATNNGGCGNVALYLCTNNVGASPTCSCQAGVLSNGQSGAGLVCEANQCNTSNGGCSVNATCSDTVGANPTCTCNSGYTGNGTTCTDVNECSDNSATCTTSQQCTNSAGGFSCSACPSGYTNANGLESDNCEADINECSDNSAACTTSQQCTNSAGSYSCSACPSGYTNTNGLESDGCEEDINECADNSATCTSSQQCTNTAGSFTCSACPSGYTNTNGLENDGCEADVDECASDTDTCTTAETCSNSVGSFSCSACPSGYVNTDRVEANGCEADIDECADNSATCSTSEQCTNTNGNFTCSACPSGYTNADGLESNGCEAAVSTASVLTLYPTVVTVKPSTTMPFQITGGTPPYTWTASAGSLATTGTTRQYTASASAGVSATVSVVDAAGSTVTAQVTTANSTLGVTPAVTTVVQGYTVTFSVGGYGTTDQVGIGVSGTPTGSVGSAGSGKFSFTPSTFGAEVGATVISFTYIPTGSVTRAYVRVVKVKSLTAGQDHSCAVFSHGQAKCWGRNNTGQLGVGNTTDQSSAASAPFMDRNGVGVKALSAGRDHTCGLFEDGTAACWGGDGYGQLGLGTASNTRTSLATATSISLGSSMTFKAIKAGYFSTCAHRSDDRLICWGSGANGQLGINSTYNKYSPDASQGQPSSPVSFTGQGASVNTVRSFTMGASSESSVGWVCAILDNAAKSAYCWGGNTDGQIGSSSANTKVPVSLAVPSGATNYESLTAGHQTTCGVLNTGRVYCFGESWNSSLGATAGSMQTYPAGVTISKVATGLYTGFSVSSIGAVYSWGYGATKCLGVSDASNQTSPTLLGGYTAVDVVSQGYYSSGYYSNTLMLLTDGTVRGFGKQSYGQLGKDASTGAQQTPPTLIRF